MPMTDGEVQILNKLYIADELKTNKNSCDHSTCEGGRPLALGRTTRTLNTGISPLAFLRSILICGYHLYILILFHFRKLSAGG